MFDPCNHWICHSINHLTIGFVTQKTFKLQLLLYFLMSDSEPFSDREGIGTVAGGARSGRSMQGTPMGTNPAGQIRPSRSTQCTPGSTIQERRTRAERTTTVIVGFEVYRTGDVKSTPERVTIKEAAQILTGRRGNLSRYRLVLPRVTKLSATSPVATHPNPGCPRTRVRAWNARRCRCPKRRFEVRFRVTEARKRNGAASHVGGNEAVAGDGRHIILAMMVIDDRCLGQFFSAVFRRKHLNCRQYTTVEKTGQIDVSLIERLSDVDLQNDVPDLIGTSSASGSADPTDYGQMLIRL